jgi:branched-chain amino acid transport system ATP-binding protein
VTPPVLELADVHAGYRGTPALRGVDLVVRAGEVVALLGRNGAGKTTALRAVSGLVALTAGRIILDGVDLQGRSPEARSRLGITHVPQGRGLFPSLTVAEHFRLGHLDEAAAFDWFPALEPLRDRRVGLLSGGEQQMLALARGLACRPRLLLLDELSLGLAPVVLQRLLPLVRSCVEITGSAVVLAEQQVGVALEVADRACVLSRGQVVMHRSAAELRADERLLRSSYLGEAG